MKIVTLSLMAPLLSGCAGLGRPATAPAATVESFVCTGPEATLLCEYVDAGKAARLGCGLEAQAPQVALALDARRLDVWFAADGTRPARRYRFRHHGNFAPATLKHLLHLYAGDSFKTESAHGRWLEVTPKPAAGGTDAVRRWDFELRLQPGTRHHWQCVRHEPPAVVTRLPEIHWRGQRVDGGLRDLLRQELPRAEPLESTP